MAIPVVIGTTTYQAPQQGARGWGPDTTNLLVRLGAVANQVVTSQYILTADYQLKDTTGTYGLKTNFVKGVGAIASADGFIRMASPYANPGQGLAYPSGTPEGKAYTYVSWRNTTNDADLHLLPSTDNVTLQFAGKAQVNVDAAQTISNKILDNTNQVSGLAITAGTITNAQISTTAAVALSKLAAVTASKLLVSDASGVISASTTTSTEAGYLSGVTSSVQTQLNSKVTANAGITPGTATKVTYDAKGLVTAGTTLAASDIPSGVDAAKISGGTVSNTIFNYLQNVTSDIQTQLNAKQVGNAPITAGTATKITYDTKGLVTAGTSLAATDLPTGIDVAKLSSGLVSNAKFDFLANVASDVQAQINNKQTKTVNLTSLSAINSGTYVYWNDPVNGFLTTSSTVVRNDISPLTTKGDLWVYDSTNNRLGVGANNFVLTADSTAASGMKWAAPAGGTFTASSADTLTNKSIDGLSNTFTNVPFSAVSTFTSSTLAGKLTDETGTGSVVFSNSPTLVTPNLGTPSALIGTNVTGVPLTTGVTGTLPIGNGGTGQTTANAALNALLPSQTSQASKYLQTDGTNTSWASASGGLSGIEISASQTAVTNTMYEVDVTAGSVTLTLPSGTGAAVVGALDAKGIVSSTKKIIFAPATGQSIDNYPVNDTASLQYPNAQAVLYRAAGSTVWKGQYQAATLIAAGSVPGITSGTTTAGAIGESGRVALTGTANTSVNSTYVDSSSFTLQPGKYALTASVLHLLTTNVSNTVPSYAIAIRTAANTIVEQVATQLPLIVSTQSINQNLMIDAEVNISVATTFKVSVQAANVTNAVVQILADTTAPSGISNAANSFVRWRRIG